MSLLFIFSACTKAPIPNSPIEKGHQIFVTNCVSCHGPDPKKDGPIGPAIAGSSLPLLEARVLYTKYPPGYTPKRTTALMVALPHLKNDLKALYEYLNSSAVQ